MKIRADFNAFAELAAADQRWVASPAAGVDRVMLDRIGGERARATSIVRYAPDSVFPEHEHTGGEEYFVLAGEFGDEHGRYPAGTYVRNPIGTKHSPRVGAQGATIWVKLRQFVPGDQQAIVIDTQPLSKRALAALDLGRKTIELHRSPNEHVTLELLAPGHTVELESIPGGAEILVVGGTIETRDKTYTDYSWLRAPPDSSMRIVAQSTDTVLLLKTGHLGKHFVNVM